MVVFLLSAPPLLAQETKTQTPRAQYETLLKEFREAEEAWNRRYNVEAGRDSKVDWEARYRDWPGWSFPPRFLKLAEANASDPVATEALLQIILELRQGVSENAGQYLPHYSRAVQLLARDHLNLNARRLMTVCYEVGRGCQSPPAEDFLRTILEKSPDRAVRGFACVSLATYLMKKRETVLRPWFEDKARSPFLSFLIKNYDPSYVRYIRGSDPQALYKEAEELYERAIKEYGDIVWWKDPNPPGHEETITHAARMQLNDLRLSVGAVAPEIEGQDIDGLPMKLSDHRGKVIVLSFWGSWCGPCMAKVSRERSLVERLAGRRFVLLGVNSDEDRGHAKEVVQKERMTWRSWWDGVPPGPIATRWGVRGWPMLYVIDAEGVIRYRANGYDEKLDKVVDTVLEGIESDKPR